nr:PREDICTED: tetratricopeptide repeat protein 39B-like [Bemisia tabaci]XP_018917261.1 PREDICTED: tetratricopeptide repeat protein 39B-like [Bemisia tabaci]
MERITMADSDSDLDDEFEDAFETQPIPCEMDLDTALDEAKTAINLFFNNKFNEAKEMMKPWVGTSMYHTIGNSVFDFLEAVLTFNQHSIQKAGESLKDAIQLCNYYRKKNTFSESIGKMVRRTNYDVYTNEEVHAELCFAESLLLKALLSFIEDETLVSFIRAGLKIRSCFNSYKECSHILNHRNWAKKEPHKIHFESGVRVGIGAFNLMISLLPTRIIKLLEFIGFSGSKELGLQELEASYGLTQGLRQVLSVMTLLSYNLIVVYVFSHTDGDLQFCDTILKKQLMLYPEGAWFLYFKGRLEFMRGNLKEANSWYTKSWKSQNTWVQFHHICFWELLWTNSINLDWKEANIHATSLLNDSRWSRTIYSYHKVSIMLMYFDDLSGEEQQAVVNLMRNVPRWKQRIAGKSIPMEKFCVKKSKRFFLQNNKLILPALELIYVWNLFKVIGKKRELSDRFYKVISDAELKFEKDPEQYGSEFEADNRALLYLLKGACLRRMNNPMLAEENLRNVVALEKKIKEDNYLVPYALVELGIMFHEGGDNQRAIQTLDDAKKNYTGYSLESRLHFQMHSAMMELQSLKHSNKN